jgi:hypothetical protein
VQAYFEEPTYKDMHHLFSNMLKNLGSVTLTTPELTRQLQEQLTRALKDGCTYIKQAVIANACGRNLSHASGLSIYLPSDTLHTSYATTDFGRNSLWTTMLRMYLRR